MKLHNLKAALLQPPNYRACEWKHAIQVKTCNMEACNISAPSCHAHIYNLTITGSKFFKDNCSTADYEGLLSRRVSGQWRYTLQAPLKLLIPLPDWRQLTGERAAHAVISALNAAADQVSGHSRWMNGINSHLSPAELHWSSLLWTVQHSRETETKKHL